MKVNDSGMPEESYWNSLFNIPTILDWLNIKNINAPIVEIGCGYGTFTLPIAKSAKNKIYSFDIEQKMVEITRKKIESAGLTRVELTCRDIIKKTTGLKPNSVGMVLLFNILHSEERKLFLEESYRILKSSGIAAVIHWRKDIPTPRGPLVHLRPDEKIIVNTIKGMDFQIQENSTILPPYHWGIRLVKGGKI